MSADEHINGTQLKMFMSASEIMQGFHPIDLRQGDSRAEMWRSKMHQAREYGANEKHESMAHSIVAEGVKSPVTLVHRGIHTATKKPELLGGHHRVAVMFYSDPDAPTIPVVHHERAVDAMQPAMQRYYRYT